MIALKWAEVEPNFVLTVTAIKSSLFQCSPFYNRLIPKNYLIFLKMFLQEKIIDNEFRILKVTSNKYKQNLKYLIQFVKFSTFYPLTRLNFIKQLLLVNKIKIKRIPASKLNIIISEKIQLVNPKCSLAVTKVFGGNQWIHRAAGHDLPLDESAWLSQLLKKVVLID